MEGVEFSQHSKLKLSKVYCGWIRQAQPLNFFYSCLSFCQESRNVRVRGPLQGGIRTSQRVASQNPAPLVILSLQNPLEELFLFISNSGTHFEEK